MSKSILTVISCPNHYNHDFWSLDELLVIAFLERSHNVVLSRVLWDGGPCIEVCDVMGPCIKVATPMPPRSRGETNDIIVMCCIFWSVGSLFRKVLVSELWTCTIKNPFFSLKILLGTDIILYSFERSLKWPFLGIFTVGVNKNFWLENHAEPMCCKECLWKNDFKALYHFHV